MRTYEYINANLPFIGIGMLVFVAVGAFLFILGRSTANRGPTKTVETYTPKNETDLPGWEDAPR